MRFALASVLALAAAVVSGAAQRSTILTNGRNLQIPINHGLPDQPLGFTFCRLRYQNIRRARKSGWGDADAIGPPAVGRELCELLPDARLHIVRGGDHNLAQTHADQIAPLITEHLQ